MSSALLIPFERVRISSSLARSVLAERLRSQVGEPSPFTGVVTEGGFQIAMRNPGWNTYAPVVLGRMEDGTGGTLVTARIAASRAGLVVMLAVAVVPQLESLFQSGSLNWIVLAATAGVHLGIQAFGYLPGRDALLALLNQAAREERGADRSDS